MKKRIPTAIILVLFIIPLLIVDEIIIASEVIFSLLAIFASYEIFRLSEYSNKKIMFMIPSFFTALNTLAISNFLYTMQPVNLSLSGYKYYFLFIPLFTIILGKLITVNNADSRNYFYLSMTYPGFGFGAILLLRAFGIKYVLFIVLIAALTDTFAYVTGRLFGRTRLAPNISPNKTIAGFIGGIIVSVSITTPLFVFYNKLCSISFLQRFNNYGNILSILALDTKSLFVQLVITFFIACFISIFSQIGDLYASSIKRSAGIKDFSKIFPGHGGVLDRFDSLIFAACLFASIILVGGAF